MLGDRQTHEITANLLTEQYEFSPANAVAESNLPASTVLDVVAVIADKMADRALARQSLALAIYSRLRCGGQAGLVVRSDCC